MQGFPKDRIRAVFTDLDDTLTESSRISPATSAALWDLKQKGHRVVIVSGRPAGWADCLMRLWPLDAMVCENGAGYCLREGEKIRTIGLAPDKDLTAQRRILQQHFDALKTRIPHLKLATDQPYRLYDYAIDFGEEPPRLSEAEIEEILSALGSAENITAKLSSIHVNYWYGKHTKVTACQELLARHGNAWGINKDQVVFCGDSPNDEPLFAFFEHTVGVANIARYLARMKTKPKYVTAKPAGLGFAEIASLLPDLRPT